MMRRQESTAVGSRGLDSFRRKIKSQSGASITYALLLFLVCAVVSSVILAAGTAASGRISESVDNDRRYFAVTSAARLLRSEFEKYEVRIDQTIKKSDSSLLSESPWYRKKEDAKGSIWKEYKDSDPDRTDRIITMSAVKAYTNLSKTSGATTVPATITLGFEDADSEYAKALSVDVKEKIYPDTGRIDLEITSSRIDGNTDDYPYTMVLVFNPDVKVSSREKIVKDDYGSDITVTVKQTKIGWEFSSVGSPESPSE